MKKQILSEEFKRMQKLAGIKLNENQNSLEIQITKPQLNEGSYTQKEILRGNMQGFKAPNPEELKVNMMVAPNMVYLDNQELLNQQMGRITAISGDKVTYKKGDGKLYNADVADIIIVN